LQSVHSPPHPPYPKPIPLTPPQVRNLALSYPASALAHANPNAPFLIYLTARDPKRGEQAVQSLHQDPQLKKAKALAEDGGLTSIKFHELDIEKEESIKAFAEFLRGEHGSVDTVVNNAGIAPQDGGAWDVFFYLFIRSRACAWDLASRFSFPHTPAPLFIR